MAKKRKRFKHHDVVAQNALSGSGPRTRKRFGKKQKRMLIIIAVGILVFGSVVSYFVRDMQRKRAEEIAKAQQGEILNINADKKQYDELGNPVKSEHETKITVFNIGNGSATLIQKDDFEMLIDAGSPDISTLVKPNLIGSLDYLVVTSDSEACCSGLNNIYENIVVDNTIYAHSAKKLLKNIKAKEEANEQIVDMGEGLSATIYKGVGGSKAGDRSALVVVQEDEAFFWIAGDASEKNVLSLLNRCSPTINTLILAGQPSEERFKTSSLVKLAPNAVLFSSTDLPDAKFTENADKLSLRNVYTTKEYGKITITKNSNDIKMVPEISKDPYATNSDASQTAEQNNPNSAENANAENNANTESDANAQ